MGLQDEQRTAPEQFGLQRQVHELGHPSARNSPSVRRESRHAAKVGRGVRSHSSLIGGGEKEGERKRTHSTNSLASPRGLTPRRVKLLQGPGSKGNV